MALILDPDSFSEDLKENVLLFFGSGSKKWQSIAPTHNAFFADVPFHAGLLGILAEKKFVQGQFTDIVYSEPLYVKEFYTHAKK